MLPMQILHSPERQESQQGAKIAPFWTAPFGQLRGERILVFSGNS
jgi:hypothetical protein